MDQKLTPLFSALYRFSQKEKYSLHVPGHKGGHVFQNEGRNVFKEILKIDLTEVEGLDDLHSPEGVIKEAQDLLTGFYQTKQSFFLVNGSTVGNLAMVLASCSPGDLVLVQRNAHKSIFNALKLARVKAVFLKPEVDPNSLMAVGLSINTVKEALSRYPHAKALILTYPNYYGQTVPIEDLINFAKNKGLGVLVDEAHGPHFKWGRPFPASSLSYGADLVVHSAHKMLPAMTMGAYLHLNSNWVRKERVQAALSMLQSSSPSYPLMASLDLARSFLATLEPKNVIQVIDKLDEFKRQLKKELGWSIVESTAYSQDPLKITLHIPGYSGFQVKTAFESVGYFPEMADPKQILLTFGLGEAPPIESMLHSFLELGLIPDPKKDKLTWSDPPVEISPNPIDLSEMEQKAAVSVLLEQSIGYISGEDVIPYPPGIPVLLKGETITSEHIKQISEWKQVGASFHGAAPTNKEEMMKVLCL